MRKYDDIYLEKTFAARFREALDDNMMSMEDLEDAEVLSASAAKSYLRGDSLPQLRTVYYIAEYLGVSIDWLCGLD